MTTMTSNLPFFVFVAARLWQSAALKRAVICAIRSIR
jgi:hypothetical protein